MCSLTVKRLRKVQTFLWNNGIVQIWPYYGASKCLGHSVSQTSTLVYTVFTIYIVNDLIH